jgi:hypothetical protein
VRKRAVSGCSNGAAAPRDDTLADVLPTDGDATPAVDAVDLASWAAGLAGPERPRRRPHLAYRAFGARLLQLAGQPRVQVQCSGRSVQGEPIWCVTVAPPQLPAQATVFVLAGLHAMEHAGVAAALALLERASSAETPWRDRRLAVLPLANPDGFRAVEDNLARGRRRFVRGNARGVDLNRNFAAFWDGSYYLHRLLPRVYAPGPAPLSEPESAAVDRLLGALRPALAVSLHAFGRWIFLPYAGSEREPEAAGQLLSIARTMVSRQPEPYRIAQLGRRSRWFRARGAEIDHMLERHGVLAFLIEIGAGPRLAAPATWLSPYRWYTPPDALLQRDVASVVAAVEALAGV